MAKQNQTIQQGAAVIVGPLDLGLTDAQKRVVSPESFSCAVRALMQNWRQGTVACKDRGEVAFSNKKPWKQKGTGRARAGSMRSPLWRKGGVIFGPQPRVRTLKISKSVRAGVFQTLLWNSLEKKSIFALDFAVQNDKPKTALAFNALRDAGLLDKKVVLFVASHDSLVHASFSNIANVRMILFDQPNAYILADADCWVYLQKDSESFKEMVNVWI